MEYVFFMAVTLRHRLAMPSKKPGKITFKGKIDPRLIPTDPAPGYEWDNNSAPRYKATTPR